MVRSLLVTVISLQAGFDGFTVISLQSVIYCRSRTRRGFNGSTRAQFNRTWIVIPTWSCAIVPWLRSMWVIAPWFYVIFPWSRWVPSATGASAIFTTTFAFAPVMIAFGSRFSLPISCSTRIIRPIVFRHLIQLPRYLSSKVVLLTNQLFSPPTQWLAHNGKMHSGQSLPTLYMLTGISCGDERDSGWLNRTYKYP